VLQEDANGTGFVLVSRKEPGMNGFFRAVRVLSQPSGAAPPHSLLTGDGPPCARMTQANAIVSSLWFDIIVMSLVMIYMVLMATRSSTSTPAWIATLCPWPRSPHYAVLSAHTLTRCVRVPDIDNLETYFTIIFAVIAVGQLSVGPANFKGRMCIQPHGARAGRPCRTHRERGCVVCSGYRFDLLLAVATCIMLVPAIRTWSGYPYLTIIPLMRIHRVIMGIKPVSDLVVSMENRDTCSASRSHGLAPSVPGRRKKRSARACSSLTCSCACL
jgi:hypothetical protein